MRFPLFLLLFSCIALWLPSTGRCQEFRYYAGTIHQRYPIVARLEVDSVNGMVYGYYRYTSQSKDILLNGELKADSLFLGEDNGLQSTGRFCGRIFSGDSITGIWDDLGKKKYSFSLHTLSRSAYEKQLPYREPFGKIRYQVLKNLVARFWHMPGDTGTVNRLQSEWNIPGKYIRGFLFPENYEDIYTEEELYEMNRGYTYYYGYVFFRENYLGLFVNRYFTPGAGGVNDYNVFLLTYDYFGNPVDREELGCNCMDTNMGSNDYYQTEIRIRLELSRILVDITDTHATLFEEELEDGQKPVDEVKHRKKSYSLTSEGSILTLPGK